MPDSFSLFRRFLDSDFFRLFAVSKRCTWSQLLEHALRQSTEPNSERNRVTPIFLWFDDCSIDGDTLANTCLEVAVWRANASLTSHYNAGREYTTAFVHSRTFFFFGRVSTGVRMYDDACGPSHAKRFWLKCVEKVA